MSRSNPTETGRNPAKRWFEWAGGGDGGYVSWYDKDNKQEVRCPDKFTFLLLDELSSVKGWHDASESAIYSNEVRDTRQDVLVVKAFKGGELASGLYPAIRDRVKAMGGRFHNSCYIAFKDGDGTMKLGNLGFKGAVVRDWMEFKKTCPTKKDANGKTVKAYYVDAICIDGFKDGKKGSIKFRTPIFTLKPVGAETNTAAVALDAELQAFLSDYLKRTRTDAAAVTAKTEAPAPAVDQQAEEAPPADTFQDDDIPF